MLIENRAKKKYLENLIQTRYAEIILLLPLAVGILWYWRGIHFCNLSLFEDDEILVDSVAEFIQRSRFYHVLFVSHYQLKLSSIGILYFSSSGGGSGSRGTILYWFVVVVVVAQILANLLCRYTGVDPLVESTAGLIVKREQRKKKEDQ